MAKLRATPSETAAVRGGLGQRITSIRTFQALENGAFRTLWLGMIASYLAMQMAMIARGYLAFQISGSATALGLVTMARGLPQLFLSPFGGVLADRVDKRRMLILTQGSMSAIAVLTATLIAMDVITIWQLVALGLLEGVVWAFNMPSRQSIVAEIVPEENLMNAIALNASALNFTRIAGPALAGLLMSVAWFGVGGVFYLVAIAYTVFVFALFNLPRERNVMPRLSGSVFGQMASGFTYTFRNKPLFLLMVMAFIPIVLGMSYQTLLPVFQERVLGVGVGGLGMLSAFSGMGALIGSLTLASLSGIRRKEQLQIAFGVIFGVSLVLFALTSTFLLALIFILLVGLWGNAYTALNNTLIMTTTDRAYHGRVMSIYMMTWSLSPLASLPIGAAVDAFGVQQVVAVFGVAVIAVILGLSPLRLKHGIVVAPAPAVGTPQR